MKNKLILSLSVWLVMNSSLPHAEGNKLCSSTPNDRLPACTEGEFARTSPIVNAVGSAVEHARDARDAVNKGIDKMTGKSSSNNSGMDYGEEPELPKIPSRTPEQIAKDKADTERFCADKFPGSSNDNDESLNKISWCFGKDSSTGCSESFIRRGLEMRQKDAVTMARLCRDSAYANKYQGLVDKVKSKEDEYNNFLANARKPAPQLQQAKVDTNGGLGNFITGELGPEDKLTPEDIANFEQGYVTAKKTQQDALEATLAQAHKNSDAIVAKIDEDTKKSYAESQRAAETAAAKQSRGSSSSDNSSGSGFGSFLGAFGKVLGAATQAAAIKKGVQVPRPTPSSVNVGRPAAQSEQPTPAAPSYPSCNSGGNAAMSWNPRTGRCERG